MHGGARSGCGSPAWAQALASGQSVANAYNQGIVALRIAASTNADLPTSVNRDDVDTANLIYVTAATN